MDGEKWLQLVSTTFTVDPSRKALVWTQAIARQVGSPRGKYTLAYSGPWQRV